MKQTLSLADIQHIKKLAKQASTSHPTLTHSKRLDLVSTAEFRLRDYHEATKLREKDILKHVESTDGGLAHCSFCHLNFHPLEDKREHHKRHDAFEEAVSSLQYAPSAHTVSEKNKALAWKATYQSETIEGKAEGYLGVFRAWFDRSLMSAIILGYWKKHPPFDQYVSMIIAATDIPKEVQDHLTAIYGRRDGEIEAGSSYWNPPR